MNVKRVRKHLMALDLRTECPPAFTLLQTLFGMTAAEIATSLNRSSNQMTYYKNGRTPLPEKVNDRLRTLLEEAVKVVDEVEVSNPQVGELMDAISALTHQTIEAMRQR